MTWLVVLLAVFLLFGGANAVVRLVEGRRKFLLDLKRQEAQIAAAKVRERELEYEQAVLEQQRQELEYRKALLELEQFDRRIGLPGRLPTELYPDATAAPKPPARPNHSEPGPPPTPSEEPPARDEPDATS